MTAKLRTVPIGAGEEVFGKLTYGRSPDKDFITGISLAGVAITQGEAEVDRSIADGGDGALKVPTFEVVESPPGAPAAHGV